MAYSDFNLKQVSQKFGLAVVRESCFDGAAEVAASPILTTLLGYFDPLARAINTEKARSEFLIAPILADVRLQLHNQISLFSGVDFAADPAQGLSGTCDFLLSRSPEQEFLTAPIVAVVEAKNGNLKSALGQCIAAMLGAKIYNEREGSLVATIFGVVTTGTAWQFLRVDESTVRLDPREYPVEELARILGILMLMLSPLTSHEATSACGETDAKGPR